VLDFAETVLAAKTLWFLFWDVVTS